MPAVAVPDLHEVAALRLRRVKQRFTVGRCQLVDLLATATRPLTIPEILERRADLAQSSVYRNLAVLEQAGVVHRIVSHGDHARYELAEDLTEHHHHLVCSGCGRVEDLPASGPVERSVAAAVAEAAARTDFVIHEHRLDLVGLCRRCA